jgi:TonB-dependent starch-binding outer membrane protein SusC
MSSRAFLKTTLWTNACSLENNIVDKRLFSSAYLDVKITNELFLKSTIGLDFRDYRRGYYKGYNTIANVGRNSSSGVELNNYFNYTWENTLNYNKSIGNHQNQGLLGTSSLGTKLEEYTSSGNNQASPITSFHDLNSNTISKAIGSKLRETKIASFFGRVNYKLSNKYVFQASLRADGSSVLAAGNKWGYFPSVSGAWRVIEEPFLQNSKVLNDLKLRVLNYALAGVNQVMRPLILMQPRAVWDCRLTHLERLLHLVTGRALSPIQT